MVRTAVMIGIDLPSEADADVLRGAGASVVCATAGAAGLLVSGWTTGVPGAGSSGAETGAGITGACGADADGSPPRSFRTMLKLVPSEVAIWR